MDMVVAEQHRLFEYHSPTMEKSEPLDNFGNEENNYYLCLKYIFGASVWRFHLRMKHHGLRLPNIKLTAQSGRIMYLDKCCLPADNFWDKIDLQGSHPVETCVRLPILPVPTRFCC